MNRPSSGVAITSGSPVVSQCASALAATASSSGVSPIRIRSSEPSSWSAANSRSSASRLASSAPSHRIAGPIRAEQREVGPDARTASASPRSGRTARRCRAPPPTRTASRMSRMNRADERAHAALAPSRSSFAPLAARSAHGSPPRSVPPPARCCRIRPASVRLGVAVERRGRLVEQPDRPRHGDQARDRQPPPLAGRQVGRPAGRRGRRGRPRPAPARPARVAAEIARPRRRGFRRPSAMASGRPGGRGSAPAPAMVRSGSPPASASRPPAIRTRPAIMRSSDDLPAPLRPVTSSASPAGDREIRAPENTSRPPRTQARSLASSRIATATGTSRRRRRSKALKILQRSPHP